MPERRLDPVMTPARIITTLCQYGPRMPGSLGHEKTRQFLLAELATIPHARIERDPFPVEVDEDLSVGLSADGVDIPAQRFAACVARSGQVEGAAQWCQNGSPRQLLAARGKIAVVQASLRHHRIRQIATAAQCGVLGLISLGNHPSDIEHGLGATPNTMPNLVGIGVAGQHADRLRRAKSLRMQWQVERKRHQCENLICHLPGSGRPILLLAHYDAWAGGAADNAAGVAVAIAVCRRLAAMPHRPAIRLVLTDAEELGLLGSAHYCFHHSLAGLRACINLDQPVPGRGECIRSMFLGLPWLGTATPLMCLRRGFLPLPLDWIYKVLGELFPSDVHHPYKAGIPACTTFCQGPRHTAHDLPHGLEAAGLQRAINLTLDLLRVAPESCRAV